MRHTINTAPHHTTPHRVRLTTPRRTVRACKQWALLCTLCPSDFQPRGNVQHPGGSDYGGPHTNTTKQHNPHASKTPLSATTEFSCSIVRPNPNPHSNLGDNNIGGGPVSAVTIVAISAVIVIALVVVIVVICICIKKHTTKETSPPGERSGTVFALNPYHLAEFALTDFLKQEDFRAEGSLEKGFESSNFRVVKDALTQRVNALGGMSMPQRYITTAIKGLIKHHTGSSQHQQFENLMVQTEIAMAEKNEHGAGVMAEMFWSSSLSIQGTELCSILNAAIREDDRDNIVYAGNPILNPNLKPNPKP